MDKVLFSKKNIDIQCLKIMQITQLQKSKKNILFCRNAAISEMKRIFLKYKDRKPDDMSNKEFMTKICNKTVHDCVIGIKKIQQRIASEQRQKFDGLSAGMGAPLADGEGEYITATGEMGEHMQMVDDRQVGDMQHKLSKEQLDDEYNKRVGNYDRNYNLRAQQPANMNGRNPFALPFESSHRESQQRPSQQQMQQQNQNMFPDLGGNFDMGNMEGFGNINDSGMLLPEGSTIHEQPIGDAHAAMEKLKQDRSSQDAYLSNRQQRPARFDSMMSPNQQYANNQQYGNNQRAMGNQRYASGQQYGNDYQQNNNFFLSSPSNREGELPSPSEIMNNYYVNIANEIIRTNNFDVLKKLSSSEVDNVISVLKKNKPQPSEIQHDKIEKVAKQEKIIRRENKKLNCGVVVSKKHNNEEQDDLDLLSLSSSLLKVDNQNILEIDGKNFVDDTIYYNDFMVTLPKQINNVTKINLSNLKLFRNEKNITSCNNCIKFSLDETCHQIEINSGKYDVITLINELNNTTSENKIDMTFTLCPDKRILIKSSSQFTLINEDNSLLKVLGFIDKKYSEKSEYTSDNKISLDDNPKMFIQLIYNGNEKLTSSFEIPENQEEIILTKRLNKPLEKLENVVIRVLQSELIYYDLCGHSPKFTIEFI